MQLLVGYRLIGEFAMQWLFIVAGVVIAFHLGLGLSRSIPASLAMLARYEACATRKNNFAMFFVHSII